MLRGNKKPVVWLVMVRAFLLAAAVWLNLAKGACVNVDEPPGDLVLRHREAERFLSSNMIKSTFRRIEECTADVMSPARHLRAEFR